MSGTLTALAELGTLAWNIYSSYEEADETERAQNESRELAYLQRSDTLEQQRITNLFNQTSQALTRNRLSFDKMAWGEGFKLTKQQYLDKRNAYLAAMRRQGKLDAVGSMFNYLNQDRAAKNSIIQNMGV